MVHSKVIVYLLQDGCRQVVCTWALKGLVYHDFEAFVGTRMVLGGFGKAPKP